MLKKIICISKFLSLVDLVYFSILKQFLISLTLPVPEKLKNLISEMPIIPQTLNINDLRTTSTKSINLQTI